MSSSAQPFFITKLLHAAVLFMGILALHGSTYTWDSPSFRILSQDALQRISQRATRVAYPDADTIILDNVTDIRYDADGKFIQVCDIATKIMTETGRDSHRIVSSYYASSYSRAKVPVVELIKPDGRTIAVDLQKHTKEMVDSSQMESNIYDWDSKIIKISVPGIEVGDILRCIYVDETFKPRIPGMFSDFITFEGPSPILHSSVTVNAPAALPLKKFIIKDRQEHSPIFSQETQDGRILYRWRVSDVPQLFPEPRMPSPALCCQRLLISTAGSWEELSRWYHQLCEPQLKSDDAILSCSRQLTAGISSFDGKVRALYTYVSQQIRYMGMSAETTAPGYEPHAVTKTFAEKAGVCRDKAALLVAMFRAIGIEAYPVLIHVGPLRDSEVPMSAFNHAITAVRHPETGQFLLMDSTNEYSRDLLPSYLSEKSYLVATAAGETLKTTPVAPCDENLLRIQNDGELTPDGTLHVVTAVSFDGINDNAYRGALLQMSTDERRKFMERLISRGKAGLKITSLSIHPADLQDTAQPLSITLSIQIPDQLITAMDSSGEPSPDASTPILFRPPSFCTSIGLLNRLLKDATLEKRRFPYRTNFACGVKEDTAIKLPPGYRIASLPVAEKKSNGMVLWERFFSGMADRLYSHTTFTCQGVSLSPGEYQSLRGIRHGIAASERKMALLRLLPTEECEDQGRASENSPPDYGAEILDLNQLVDIDTPDSYTVTKQIRLRITSYKGIGEWSDLQFEFQPAWEQVEVTSASVINHDKRITVSPEMIRLMDTPYSASAPRYPAAKRLVVAFPGVQSGSIIELTLTRRFINQPFIGIQAIAQGAIPIRKATYEFRVPEFMGCHPVLHPDGLMDISSPQERPSFHERSLKRVSGDKCSTIWSCEDMPADSQETRQPPPSWYRPVISLNYGSWKAYAETLKRYIAAMDMENDAIASLQQTITAGMSTPREKVLAIRQWVDDHIRLTEPAFTALPLTCISAPLRTIRDGYGHSMDRALVLMALLRSAKLPPCGLYLSSGLELGDAQRLLSTHLQRQQFTTALLRLQVDGQEFWLNDQSKYGQLGTCAYNRGCLLSVDTGELSRMELDDEFENCTQEHIDLTILADGTARYSVTATVSGSDYGLRKQMYALMQPEERRRHYQSIITALSPSARAVTKDLKTDFSVYPGEISYTAAIADYAVCSNDSCYFTLPCPVPEELSIASTGDRVTPLYWGSRRRLRQEIHLTISAPYRHPRLFPGSGSWRAPEGGQVYWRCKQLDTGKDSPLEFIITQHHDFNPAIILPENYPAIRKAFRQMRHPANRTMMLQR